MNEPIIATWMIRDLPGEESSYSQIGSNSSNIDFQSVYWRSIIVFFATSLRVNKHARHILFTDRIERVHVDGLDIFCWLGDHGVEVHTFPFNYRPPKGFWDSWGNQFYIFDIIQHLPLDSSACLVLDADCVWLKSAETLFAAVAKQHLLTYTLDYSEDRIVNGMSRSDMCGVFESVWGDELDSVPFYNGGELLACDPDSLKFLQQHSHEILAKNLYLFKQGRRYCREEAQTLSILYAKYGYTPFSANSFIRRIWTGQNFNNVRYPEDMSLAIWHLPAEKKLGIERLFWRVAFLNKIGGLSDSVFMKYAGRMCGIPKRRWIQDIGAKVFRRIERRLRATLD
jgi:hypothetical protein